MLRVTIGLMVGAVAGVAFAALCAWSSQSMLWGFLPFMSVVCLIVGWPAVAGAGCGELSEQVQEQADPDADIKAYGVPPTVIHSQAIDYLPNLR